MRDFFIPSDWGHRVVRNKILIPAIEKDRHATEDSFKNIDRRKNALTQMAAVIALMRKLLSQSIDDETKSLKVKAPTSSTKLFDEFKKLLFLLKDQDMATDISYAQKLSKSWNDIINAYIPAILERTPKESKKLIKEFLNMVRSYEGEADHSMGYYLTQYAGENWLPFPFIKLVRSLHEDYVAKKDQSHITRWINQIASIDKSLSGK